MKGGSTVRSSRSCRPQVRRSGAVVAGWVTCILIVEDHDLNRDMLSRRLKRRGFQVVAAADGAAGVEAALRERPDLVLMDMSLPVVDGWQATRMIKANPETSGHSRDGPDRPCPEGRPGTRAGGRLRRIRNQAGGSRPPADQDRRAALKGPAGEQPMSDVAAAPPGTEPSGRLHAGSSVSVLAASDQITDDEDLKMLEWISASIVSLQDLAGQGDAALLRDRPHRTPSATASTPSRAERSC